MGFGLIRVGSGFISDCLFFNVNLMDLRFIPVDMCLYSGRFRGYTCSFGFFHYCLWFILILSGLNVYSSWFVSLCFISARLQISDLFPTVYGQCLRSFRLSDSIEVAQSFSPSGSENSKAPPPHHTRRGRGARGHRSDTTATP